MSKRNTLEELELLALMLSKDADDIDELVIYYYLGVRLKPLIGIKNITDKKVNQISNIFAKHYFTKNISIDILVNALYNYVNIQGTCPGPKFLDDDIEIFLKAYAEA